MRLLAHVYGVFLLVATAALVIYDLVIGLPFVLFAGLFALLLLFPFALGRLFEIPNFDRLLSNNRLAFTVTTGPLVITDDFNFSPKDCRVLTVPNGEYVAELLLDVPGRRIAGVTIANKEQRLAEHDRAFTADVACSVLYIVDGVALSDRGFRRSVQRLMASRLETPLAERLPWNGRCVGIAIEPGTGNGEYRFRVADGVLVASFIE